MAELDKTSSQVAHLVDEAYQEQSPGCHQREVGRAINALQPRENRSRDAALVSEEERGPDTGIGL